MKRSDIEQLTDEFIGEAVLSLLSENGPVNTQALIKRLRAMAAKEQDGQRKDVFVRVIAEISNNSLSSMHSDATPTPADWDGDQANNVYPLFCDSLQKTTRKKH